MTSMENGGAAPGALSGVRILDFTHALAGPYATMILRDMGADVLKVEHPGGGDRTRRYTDGDDTFSPYFGSVNRGKRSAVIDLKQNAGLDLARRLANQADVVVHNMGPGVADRIGLGHEDLTRSNPRLLYAVVTGFGLDGPWAERVGVDPIIQALSGSMSVTGEPGGTPCRVGYSIVDLVGGLYLAIGILGGLQERERSGRGQLLDISLFEAQMALMENAVVRYLATGKVPQPVGSAHPYQTLTRCYETKDGWMMCMLSARNWKAACKLWGRNDWLEDPELQSWPEKSSAKLIPEVQKILRSQTRGYWMEHLVAAGVRCTPVNTIAEALETPPMVERGFIQETVDAKGRRLRVSGSPIRLSRTPGRVQGAAPVLGQHTQDALQDWLGLSEEEYKRLEAEGVFREVGMATRGFW
jgi:crotonobetainyl-CoA:carnitine CoA-transferase CaiB-like acyl-CoA transferase